MTRLFLNETLVYIPLLHAAQLEQLLCNGLVMAHLLICHFGGSLEIFGSDRSKIGLVLSHPATQGFPGIMHLLGMGSMTTFGLAWQYYYNKICSRPGPLPKMPANLTRHENLPPFAEGPQLRIRGYFHLFRLAQQLSNFVITLGHDLQAQYHFQTISGH